MEILSFILGIIPVMLIGGLPEVLVPRPFPERRLGTREFCDLKSGKVLIVILHFILFPVFFFLSILPLSLLFPRIPSHPWLSIFIPGLFFLTMELPLAMLELAFGVSVENQPIRYIVDGEVRRRGRVRMALIFCHHILVLAPLWFSRP